MTARGSSISRRLIASMLISMPLLLGLTAVAIDRAYHSSLLKAEENRLLAQFFSLLGAVEWSEERGFQTEDRLKEPAFWQFRSGLYADIQDPQGRQLWRSLSAETVSLPHAFPNRRSGDSQGGEVEIEARPFLYYRFNALWETDSGRDIPITISLYSEQTDLLREQKQFRRQMAIWLAAVALISVLLISVLQYWGLQPLRRLARELRDLERGKSERLGKNYPIELGAITNNLNQLIEKERRQRERYRNTLGDLAHSLKTPLAVLKSGQLDDAQRSEQIQRMDNIVRYQLRRAVTSGRQGLHSRTSLKAVLASLARSLDKVHRDRDITIAIAVDEGIVVPVDEQDAMELLGNLLDNACKACDQDVRAYTCGNNDGRIALVIENDGRGLNAQQLADMMARGRRGDQYGEGQGLGLAIVQDIADSCDIALQFEPRTGGGSRVTLTFPPLRS